MCVCPSGDEREEGDIAAVCRGERERFFVTLPSLSLHPWGIFMLSLPLPLPAYTKSSSVSVCLEPITTESVRTQPRARARL